MAQGLADGFLELRLRENQQRQRWLPPFSGSECRLDVVTRRPNRCRLYPPIVGEDAVAPTPDLKIGLRRTLHIDTSKMRLPKFWISHGNEIPGQLGMRDPVSDAVRSRQIDRGRHCLVRVPSD